jgi:hypothetical protein
MVTRSCTPWRACKLATISKYKIKIKIKTCSWTLKAIITKQLLVPTSDLIKVSTGDVSGGKAILGWSLGKSMQ